MAHPAHPEGEDEWKLCAEQREQVDRRHWRYVYNRRCSAGLLLATLTTMLLIPRQKRQTRNKERWQRPDVAASLLNVALRLCCSAPSPTRIAVRQRKRGPTRLRARALRPADIVQAAQR